MRTSAIFSLPPDPELESVIERTRQLIEASSAPATRKAYTNDFRDFTEWCSRHGFVPLPATEQTVALYCAHLSLRLHFATIARRLSAIGYVHKCNGYAENPASTARPLIGATMKGIRRTIGTRQTGREALTTEAVLNICRSSPHNLLGLRNRALFLVSYAGALRRDEAARIDVESLSLSPSGLAIFIPRSKVDPYGKGRHVGLPFGIHSESCPVSALMAWLEAGGIREGRVFRPIDRHGHVSPCGLRSDAIGRILKNAAIRAGIDATRIGAHSLRAGHVTQCALAKNVDEASVMAQTGHTSVAMVRRYRRVDDLFVNNSAKGLGL